MRQVVTRGQQMIFVPQVRPRWTGLEWQSIASHCLQGSASNSQVSVHTRFVDVRLRIFLNLLDNKVHYFVGVVLNISEMNSNC